MLEHEFFKVFSLHCSTELSFSSLRGSGERHNYNKTELKGLFNKVSLELS